MLCKICPPAPWALRSSVIKFCPSSFSRCNSFWASAWPENLTCCAGAPLLLPRDLMIDELPRAPLIMPPRPPRPLSGLVVPNWATPSKRDIGFPTQFLNLGLCSHGQSSGQLLPLVAQILHNFGYWSIKTIREIVADCVVVFVAIEALALLLWLLIVPPRIAFWLVPLLIEEPRTPPRIPPWSNLPFVLCCDCVIWEISPAWTSTTDSIFFRISRSLVNFNMAFHPASSWLIWTFDPAKASSNLWAFWCVIHTRPAWFPPHILQ